jgi:hypothetical protein
MALKHQPALKPLAHCLKLAEYPDNTLAAELAWPVVAVLDQIDDATRDCEALLRRPDAASVARRRQAARALEQLDYALALILRNHIWNIQSRGATTQNLELLNLLANLAIGDGEEAARLIQRYQKLTPNDPREADGSVSPESLPHTFAWDAYNRIAALDQLADEFPDHIRTAARSMHAWPMLMHRHTTNRARFHQLARQLELGADYPIDTSAAARYRPDTPLVRYLDPLIFRLNTACQELGDQKFRSVQEEQHWLYLTWWTWPEDCPSEEMLAAIHAAQLLPPLTKATAGQWASVPLIMATDARNYPDLAEPALLQIATHKAAKSQATFKNRLRTAVTATLRRLARPAPEPEREAAPCGNAASQEPAKQTENRS